MRNAFSYVALTRAREKVSGTVFAEDRFGAIRAIERLGCVPISVVPAAEGRARAGAASGRRDAQHTNWVAIGCVLVVLCLAAGFAISSFGPAARMTPGPRLAPEPLASGNRPPRSVVPKSRDKRLLRQSYLVIAEMQADMVGGYSSQAKVELSAERGNPRKLISSGTHEVVLPNFFEQAGKNKVYSGPSVDNDWGAGAEHTIRGVVELRGWTFDSDSKNPLVFRLERGRGYVYKGGKGQVTSPRGEVYALEPGHESEPAARVSQGRHEMQAELAQQRLAMMEAQGRQDMQAVLAQQRRAMMEAQAAQQQASGMPPLAPAASSSKSAFSKQLPAYTGGELVGRQTVRISNPNAFAVAVGLRAGGKGKDFDVPASGVRSVYVPDGQYSIYFVYSDRPDALFQGDPFSLNGNGVQIQIVQVADGNFGIRQVK
jgi:hypothetical protein